MHDFVPAHCLQARPAPVVTFCARCESTGNVLYTVRAFGEWVYRPGTPPIMQHHQAIVTARSGDTVYVRNSHSIFGLDVVSEED